MTTTDLETPTQTEHLTGSGLAGLLIGGALSAYTFGSMNNALPVIGREFGASPGALSLLLGAFACGFAATLLIAGRLGDRYGRRTLFQIGIAAFVITSVIAGLVTGTEQLIALRVLQGFAAGAFMPQVLSTIQATTSGPARVKAVSAYAAVLGVGTGVGQVLGGALIGLNLAGLTWRPVLWLGALLAVVALIATGRVPQTRTDTPAVPDVPGALMIMIGVAAVVFALSMGPSLGWPLWSVIMIVAAIAVAVIFYRHEGRIERSGRVPLAPPSIIRLPALRTGLIMACIFFLGYGGLMNIFALVSQSDGSEDGLGMSAMLSGVTAIPFVLAYVVGSMLVAPITARLGARTMIIGGLSQLTGLVAMAVIALLFTYSGTSPVIIALAIQLPFVLTGAAQAIMFGPMMQTVMSQVPVAAAGLSGGLISTVQQIGFGLGVAILGGVYHGIASGHGALAGYAGGVLINGAGAIAFVILAATLERHRR